METLARDLRYSLRMLARTPGFTALAIATLALGIGANTSIFTVANSVSLRPLAYKDPGQLVRISTKRDGSRLRFPSLFHTSFRHESFLFRRGSISIRRCEFGCAEWR